MAMVACRTAVRQYSGIHGNGSSRKSDQKLQEAAKEGKQWNKEYGPMLEAGGIPEKLKSTSPNLGSDIFLS